MTPVVCVTLTYLHFKYCVYEYNMLYLWNCYAAVLLSLKPSSLPVPTLPARNDGRNEVLTLSHVLQRVLIELTAASRQEKSQTLSHSEKV